ncbi:hypothetical protein BHM03_00058211 [Ensete ventricosum]|nr:hypothetical protein BHM03_00058211 [Ensete ventricosum]
MEHHFEKVYCKMMEVVGEGEPWHHNKVSYLCSRSHLECAEKSCGLHLIVTGALGLRTIHQVEAKPQLILAANNHEQSIVHLSQVQGDSTVSESKDAVDHKLDDCSDILMTPKLVKNGKNDDLNVDLTHINKDIKLTFIQQAVVLAQCLHLQRRSRDDELSGKFCLI